MIKRSAWWSRNFNTMSITGLSLLMAFMMVAPSLRADDEDKATSLLDGLKRRSAEDRWQRIKTLNPSETSRKANGSRSTDVKSNAADEELPPSPDTALIPRLSALPRDTSSDWVLPARPPGDFNDVLSDPVPNAARSNADSRPARMATNLQVQAIDVKAAADDGNASGQRVARERKMSEINPFYDRERDQDMREFALEKGKEFEFLSKTHPAEDRLFPQIPFAWEAANFWYYPLYFADPALERYGHSHHPVIQPIASVARAGVQFVFLPYQMVIEPPCMQTYPLGWYRPGECAPKLHYQPPLNAEAALVEAAAVTGLYFALVP